MGKAAVTECLRRPALAAQRRGAGHPLCRRRPGHPLRRWRRRRSFRLTTRCHRPSRCRRCPRRPRTATRRFGPRPSRRKGSCRRQREGRCRWEGSGRRHHQCPPPTLAAPAHRAYPHPQQQRRQRGARPRHSSHRPSAVRQRSGRGHGARRKVRGRGPWRRTAVRGGGLPPPPPAASCAPEHPAGTLAEPERGGGRSRVVMMGNSQKVVWNRCKLFSCKKGVSWQGGISDRSDDMSESDGRRMKAGGFSRVGPSRL
jgi:hypothetical protein